MAAAIRLARQSAFTCRRDKRHAWRESAQVEGLAAQGASAPYGEARCAAAIALREAGRVQARSAATARAIRALWLQDLVERDGAGARGGTAGGAAGSDPETALSRAPHGGRAARPDVEDRSRPSRRPERARQQ